MFSSSLFPDYAVLEVGRNEAQAMRLAQQLRDVDLQVLATTVDRRTVISRLRREGIADAMQLILLTEAEVMGWFNVGPVFLAILSEMRQEVIGNPERVVDEWRNRIRLYVLPDDLAETSTEDDFFGLLLAEESSEYNSASASSDPVVEVERCLVAAVEMMARRDAEGEVLRRYYLEGASVESIVESLHLASNASLYRIVDRHFTQPLLKGYAVRGIQFSNSILSVIKKLKKELVYQRLEALDGLQRVPPQRFLHILGLTPLQRTTAEAIWMADYIVPEGDVQRCRHTLRRLLATLQWRVVAAKESTLRRDMQRHTTDGHTAPERQRHGHPHSIHVPFLRVLLRDHPSIEEQKKGYRLAPQRLTYTSARLARIVYDAHGPISIPEILLRYERLYLERPQTHALSKVRTHFPHVHSITRGTWQWK